jgi:putative ABC transport system permease protein
MRTLSLAVRNLLRNRRRSVATLAAIAIGGAAILLFGGYTANIRYSMETTHVRTGGHLQIQHKDLQVYGTGNPTAYAVGDFERIMAAIRADEVLGRQVRVVSPSLMFTGIAGNYGASVSRTVYGLGVVAKDGTEMRKWNHYEVPIVARPLALDGAPADAAVIGVGVARVLKLCGPLKVSDCLPEAVEAKQAPGIELPADITALSALESTAQAKKGGVAAVASPRRIELLASSAKGAPNVASLEVVAAEGQGIKELDDIYIGLQLEQAQKLVFGRSSSRVTAVMVQLEHPDQAPGAVKRIREKIAEWGNGQPLAVLDLETLNPFFKQTVTLFDTLFGFVFALIGSIVLFTVGNTMNTAVVERTVEIGTLRAMGLRQQGIRKMFLTEGVLLGVFGAIAAALLALVVAAVVNSLGLKWLPPGSSDHLPIVLRVWGENTRIIFVCAGLIVVATISAWYPAYRAAQLKVVDALRHA